MLPVTVIDEMPTGLPSSKSTASADAGAIAERSGVRSSVIEIEIAGALMRFDGKADLSMIRAVLGILRT
jgi:hypothetical protein